MMRAGWTGSRCSRCAPSPFLCSLNRAKVPERSRCRGGCRYHIRHFSRGAGGPQPGQEVGHSFRRPFGYHLHGPVKLVGGGPRQIQFHCPVSRLVSETDALHRSGDAGGKTNILSGVCGGFFSHGAQLSPDRPRSSPNGSVPYPPGPLQRPPHLVARSVTNGAGVPNPRLRRPHQSPGQWR